MITLVTKHTTVALGMVRPLLTPLKQIIENSDSIESQKSAMRLMATTLELLPEFRSNDMNHFWSNDLYPILHRIISTEVIHLTDDAFSLLNVMLRHIDMTPVFSGMERMLQQSIFFTDPKHCTRPSLVLLQAIIITHLQRNGSHKSLNKAQLLTWIFTHLNMKVRYRIVLVYSIIDWLLLMLISHF